MIMAGDIPRAEDEYDLADDLTATYLLGRKGRLLQDDITRRLLAIRQWHDMPEEFLKRCVQARDICANHMQEPNVQMPEKWVIEYLFQSLQQHAATIQDPSHRSSIRETFFTRDVPGALQMFLGGRSIPAKSRRAEHVVLSQALDADWEFRFTVNYYLRGDQYNEEAYGELQQKINDFFV